MDLGSWGSPASGTASEAMYYILYTIHYRLYTAYYTLHTIYYILHTTYYILHPGGQLPVPGPDLARHRGGRSLDRSTCSIYTRL